MAGTPYLLDSNILLRSVKPDHNDYPLVVSAIEAILRRDGRALLYLAECRGILEHVYPPYRPQRLRSFPSRNPKESRASEMG
jgi:hypothetical protein